MAFFTSESSRWPTVLCQALPPTMLNVMTGQGCQRGQRGFLGEVRGVKICKVIDVSQNNDWG